MVSLSVELYSFLLTVLMGMAAGFLFDLERVWRRLVRPGSIAVKVADVLFILFAGVGLIIGIFYASWGELRLYLLLGIACGAILYSRLASPAVSRLVEKMLRYAARIILAVAAAVRAVLHGIAVVVLPPVNRLRTPVRRIKRFGEWWGKALLRRALSIWRKLPGFFV